MTLQCLCLCRAREALRQCLPDQLKDGTFMNCLKDDNSTKRWLSQLLKNLETPGLPTGPGGMNLAPWVDVSRWQPLLFSAEVGTDNGKQGPCVADSDSFNSRFNLIPNWAAELASCSPTREDRTSELYSPSASDRLPFSLILLERWQDF